MSFRHAKQKGASFYTGVKRGPAVGRAIIGVSKEVEQRLKQAEHNFSKPLVQIKSCKRADVISKHAEAAIDIGEGRYDIYTARKRSDFGIQSRELSGRVTRRIRQLTPQEEESQALNTVHSME